MTWHLTSPTPSQWYRALTAVQRRDVVTWMARQPEPPWCNPETWFAMVACHSPWGSHPEHRS